MRKTKMMFVSLLAVFAVGAVASASASALLWSVNGSTTFGTAAISNGAIAISNGLLEGDSIGITCPTLKIEGGVIKEGKTGTATSAVFEGCKETKSPTKCVLSTSTIKTNSGSANAVNGSEIEVVPEGTTTFTTVDVLKTTLACALEGSYIVRGSARIAVANASTEETEHELILSSKSKLTINNNAATIEGTGKGKLASGLRWSIMP